MDSQLSKLSDPSAESHAPDADYLFVGDEEEVSDWPSWLGSSVWGAVWAGIGIAGVLTLIIVMVGLRTGVSDAVSLNLSRLACVALALGQSGALGWWIAVLPVESKRRTNPLEADPVGPLAAGIVGVMIGGAWRSMDWPLDVGMGVIVAAGMFAAGTRVPLQYAATAAIAAAAAVLFDTLPPALRAQMLAQEPWLILGLIGVAAGVVGGPMAVVRSIRQGFEADFPWLDMIGPAATLVVGFAVAFWLLYPMLSFANLAF
jgi:hypothetical protein